MTAASPLAPYFRRLDDFSTFRWVGRVTKVVDYLVESEGPFCSVGEGCAILTSEGRTLAGEIVGFRGKLVLSMPLERPAGIRYGDRIVTRGTRPCLRVGPGLLGRVIDGTGEPLDSKGSYGAREYWPLRGDAPLPLTPHASAKRWAAASAPSTGCSPAGAGSAWEFSAAAAWARARLSA